MNHETQQGISKEELRRALTGGARAFSEGKTSAYQFLNGKIGIDTTLEAEMDRAYLLTKKFERERRTYSGRPRYFEDEHKRIDEAYIKGDPQEFNYALESLLCSIEDNR